MQASILGACRDYVTLHWATLNRATVKRRHFNKQQLTGATNNRSDR